MPFLRQEFPFLGISTDSSSPTLSQPAHHHHATQSNHRAGVFPKPWWRKMVMLNDLNEQS